MPDKESTDPWCPVCGGDCSGANPPPMNCPLENTAPVRRYQPQTTVSLSERAASIWRANRDVRRLLSVGNEDGAIAATKPIADGLRAHDPRIRRLARRIAEGWLIWLGMRHER